jgi:hypothetical protein
MSNKSKSSVALDVNLSNHNNDFFPLERKNALRKSLGYKKIHGGIERHPTQVIRQSKIFKSKISLNKKLVRILKNKNASSFDSKLKSITDS